MSFNTCPAPSRRHPSFLIWHESSILNCDFLWSASVSHWFPPAHPRHCARFRLFIFFWTIFDGASVAWRAANFYLSFTRFFFWIADLFFFRLRMTSFSFSQISGSNGRRVLETPSLVHHKIWLSFFPFFSGPVSLVFSFSFHFCFLDRWNPFFPLKRKFFRAPFSPEVSVSLCLLTCNCSDCLTDIIAMRAAASFLFSLPLP